MTEFSASEKHEALEREIKYRRKVYPKLVSRGVMSPVSAERQIAIMVAIAADYLDEAIKERLL